MILLLPGKGRAFLPTKRVMSSPHSPESTSLPEASLTQDTPALNPSSEGISTEGHDGPEILDASNGRDIPREPDVPDVSGNKEWGSIARAICLFSLLGMALVVFARLSFGRSWVSDFLAQNRLSMTERMTFIYQMLGGGLLGGLAAPVLLFLKPPYRQSAAACEQWAWFLSPLLLLPAIPVFGRHQVWFSKHEEFLPIVLFGALIFEVLVSKASENAPQAFAKWLVDFFRDDFGTSESRVRRFLSQNGALLFVCGAALAYGAFMSFYAVRWHHKLGTAIFDLGINNNLMSGGLEGHFNESSVIFPDNPKMYVANHVKAGLYVFLPIYALFPRPETLLIIQSVFLGLGAIPLFLFVRRRLPELWAVTLTIAYLCYYPLHGANFYEMKEPPTAAVLVLACIWAIDTRRNILGGFCFAWALIMREDMPIPLAVVGACFLLSGERPRAGLIMATIATSWFVFLRFGVMNDAGSWWFPNMYEDLWAAPETGFQGVIKTLVSNPTYTLKHIFVEKKFWYLLHMLVPLAFLPTRRWWAFASFVPGAILTLLVTDYDPPITFSFQYVMHFAPYTFLASALVLAKMRREIGHPSCARRLCGDVLRFFGSHLQLRGLFAPRQGAQLRLSQDHLLFHGERAKDARRCSAPCGQHSSPSVCGRHRTSWSAPILALRLLYSTPGLARRRVHRRARIGVAPRPHEGFSQKGPRFK